MDIAIEPARPEDAGELMTVQRAAFLIEGELNNSFTLPPMTETLDEVRKAIESDTVVLVARLGHRIPVSRTWKNGCEPTRLPPSGEAALSLAWSLLCSFAPGKPSGTWEWMALPARFSSSWCSCW